MEANANKLHTLLGGGEPRHGLRLPPQLLKELRWTSMGVGQPPVPLKLAQRLHTVWA